MKNRALAPLLSAVALLSVVGVVLLWRGRSADESVTAEPRLRAHGMEPAAEPEEKVKEEGAGGPAERAKVDAEDPTSESQKVETQRDEAERDEAVPEKHEPGREDPDGVAQEEEGGEEEENENKEGNQEDDRRPWGFLVAGGRYIAPPYRTEVRDRVVVVNNVEVMRLSLPSAEDVARTSSGTRDMYDYATELVIDKYFMWRDFHSEEESRRRLEALLTSEREEGRIPGYVFEEQAVAFLQKDGEVEERVRLTHRYRPLGPPYKQYDARSDEFVRELQVLAREGGIRHGPERAKEIITRFLSSQEAVKEYSFTAGEVLVENRQGVRRTVVVEIGRPSQVRERFLARQRKTVRKFAERVERALGAGALVLISSSANAITIVPARDAKRKIDDIWQVISRKGLTDTEMVSLLGRVVRPILAQEIVAHREENQIAWPRAGED